MPNGAVTIDDMIMTKIIRPNAFAVPNPFTVFTAFTDTTKIQTTNAIVTVTNSPAYPNMGPIRDRICSSSSSSSINNDESIDAIESIIKNNSIERITDIGINGTCV